jgi:hypothetical protein
MAYMLAKEREIVTGDTASYNSLRQNVDEVRGLLILEQYFQRET